MNERSEPGTSEGGRRATTRRSLLGALAVALAVGGRSQREPTAQDVSLNASAQVTSTGPDPVLTAVAFFCGGIVALAGLFLVARIGES